MIHTNGYVFSHSHGPYLLRLSGMRGDSINRNKASYPAMGILSLCLLPLSIGENNPDLEWQQEPSCVKEMII